MDRHLKFKIDEGDEEDGDMDTVPASLTSSTSTLRSWPKAPRPFSKQRSESFLSALSKKTQPGFPDSVDEAIEKKKKVSLDIALTDHGLSAKKNRHDSGDLGRKFSGYFKDLVPKGLSNKVIHISVYIDTYLCVEKLGLQNCGEITMSMMI